MKKPMLTAALGLIVLPVAAFASGNGTVYTLSNQTAGNRVLTFNRASNGQLTSAASYATGGQGTGTGLGNQNAVTISDNNRYLFAVNSGSNSISSFRIDNNGLKLIDVEGSEGTRPISITQSGKLVYVLNAGDETHAGEIQGYVLSPKGALIPLLYASAPLSGNAVGPAQIQFDPAGRNLVVTEKGTNTIDIFHLNWFGKPDQVSYQPAAGQTPFGFDFDQRGRLFVSEAFGGAADSSALSSYRIDHDQDLNVLTGSAATTETAACWTVVSKDGKYVYTANTGSGSITGYRILNNGTLDILNEDGVTGVLDAGTTPIDVAISSDGKYLYCLGSSAHAIFSFRILSNGQLQGIDMDGSLPVGTNGLAAH